MTKKDMLENKTAKAAWDASLKMPQSEQATEAQKDGDVLGMAIINMCEEYTDNVGVHALGILMALAWHAQGYDDDVRGAFLKCSTEIVQEMIMDLEAKKSEHELSTTMS